MSDEARLFEPRGIHTTPYNGETNDWITPKNIIEKLGPFDLDPCASVHQPWPCAAKSYTYRDDGLSQPWEGRVWLNPPYGPNTKYWLGRLFMHGNGVALVAARTDTRWFRTAWERADAFLFLSGRLNFHRPDGTPGTQNSGHASVLIAYGGINPQRLQLCGLPGTYIGDWKVLTP
jgi:hypothetical protein